MRKNKSVISVLTVLLAVLVVPMLGTAGERYGPDGDTEHADSLKRQRSISEKLDFISETAIPLLDESFRLPALPELTPPTVEGRLRKLGTTVPLDYNAHVQSYIDRYSTDRYRGYLSRMMGLGQYYFRIYEQIFEETGLPAEIKYLSVVESALDPHAVSRVGATGPWQFMFATAKVYGLQMDSYIDERKDPVSASHAAARYLLEAYDQFGDWLLAIAAYNCGPGNVQRAIKRSGLENPDFWSILQFLPKETRNYVPAFIAMTYMMEYHAEFGITPAETGLDIRTEMVSVQQPVSFSALAEVTGVEPGLLKALNPAYKRNLVNGSAESPQRLVLPTVAPDNFAALYAVLNEAPSKEMLVSYAKNETGTGSSAPGNGSSGSVQQHKVSKGETLGRIAQKYRVSIQDLRAWNHIKGDRIVPGQRLVIDVRPEKPHAASSASSLVSTYVVKKGDTLSGISGKYKGTTVSSIKLANGLKSNDLRPGMQLKIQ